MLFLPSVKSPQMGFQAADRKEDRVPWVWDGEVTPVVSQLLHSTTLSAAHVLIPEDCGVTSSRTKSSCLNSGHKG